MVRKMSNKCRLRDQLATNKPESSTVTSRKLSERSTWSKFIIVEIINDVFNAGRNNGNTENAIHMSK